MATARCNNSNIDTQHRPLSLVSLFATFLPETAVRLDLWHSLWQSASRSSLSFRELQGFRYGPVSSFLSYRCCDIKPTSYQPSLRSGSLNSGGTSARPLCSSCSRLRSLVPNLLPLVARPCMTKSLRV